ncbi:hypothetical protein BDV95DRAFT_53841 [Massariosphaeria phaeospora]|uniref:Uncharacterized protein n=1 Tax=Massariosphaeria phaeospora TaxID=100035 RepID=A0A7C8I9Z9_9PLEO|nr:hypothetical protein BDV95DRAFT_53841 [Massariosphaeria phaeospora]
MNPTAITNDDLVVVSRSYLEFLRQHCCDCPRLDEKSRTFVQNSPTTISSAQLSKGTGPRKRKRATTGPLEKRDKARDYFLQHLPKSTEWHKRQAELVESPQNYERTIYSLTSRSSVEGKKDPVQGYTRREDELIAVGVDLALLAERSLQNMELQKSFSYFQLLILLSYCLFLREIGVSCEEVDRILQKVTSFREKDRRRLLIRAARINSIICKLARGGWAIYRATEIFFISMYFRCVCG